MRRDPAEAVVLDRVRRTVLTPEAIDFTVNEAIRLLADPGSRTSFATHPD